MENFINPSLSLSLPCSIPLSEEAVVKEAENEGGAAEKKKDLDETINSRARDDRNFGGGGA